VAARYASGKIVAAKDVVQPLSAAVRTGDRVCLEGDNQKQAGFLAEALASVDKARIHDLHIVQSGVVAQANKIVDIPGDMNRGIGCPTAAVELILPTYGEQLGPRGIRVQQRDRRCGRQIALCSAARTRDG
jgi:hypothetical protein